MSDSEPGGNLLETFGLSVDELSEELVTVSLEITPELHQPAGVMHGGISLVLAETAASMGADYASDDNQNVFGMEINANHLKPVESGRLRAEARPLHRGSTTHVWEVNLLNEDDDLVCRSRCTLSVKTLSD